MRYFDIAVKNLSPEFYMSASEQWGRNSTVMNKGRKITRDSDFSFHEISGGRIVDRYVEEFVISMICMPIAAPAAILVGDQLTLELKTNSKYLLTISGEQYEIPFDETCHYLNIVKTKEHIAISINDRRYVYSLENITFPEVVLFDQSQGGKLNVDKVIYSRSSDKVISYQYYKNLMPSRDITRIFDNTVSDWIFKYDSYAPRIFTVNDAEYINGYYVCAINLSYGISTVVRNRSKYDLELSFDSGSTWMNFIDYEYMPLSVDKLLVRTTNKDFEFIQDSYGNATVHLPGVDVDITGDVYPYHRDEVTFYTNAEYNFSAATLKITPIEDFAVKSLSIFGRINSDILTELGATSVFRDGKNVALADVSDDRVNHLYYININKNGEFFINQNKDKYICINAIGVSDTPQDAASAYQAFKLFSGDIVLGYSDDLPQIRGGKLKNGQSSRIVDVQWTI